MIKISSPEQQLRQNRAMLLFIGGTSSVVGLLLWSAMPFAANNPKSPLHISLRYFALVSGIGCGVTAIACGHQLEKISPLIKAIDAAEKDDFLTQLAAAQYVQSQQHEMAAEKALQPAPEPAISVMVKQTQPQGETQQQQAETALQPTTPSDVANVEVEDTEGFRPLYHSVLLAKQQGATDTQIIETVLGMSGRKFAQGRQALSTLLHLGQEKNW